MRVKNCRSFTEFLPPVRLKPKEKTESITPVAKLDDLILIEIELWQLGVVVQLGSVESIRVCSQNIQI